MALAISLPDTGWAQAPQEFFPEKTQGPIVLNAPF